MIERQHYPLPDPPAGWSWVRSITGQMRLLVDNPRPRYGDFRPSACIDSQGRLESVDGGMTVEVLRCLVAEYDARMKWLDGGAVENLTEEEREQDRRRQAVYAESHRALFPSPPVLNLPTLGKQLVMPDTRNEWAKDCK